MRSGLKLSLITASLMIVCVPMAFIATILLLPLWSWIEAGYGIESVGHSGPADWCFWSVYGVLALGAAAVVLRWRGAFGPTKD
jgi:hypothetical protein